MLWTFVPTTGACHRQPARITPLPTEKPGRIFNFKFWLSCNNVSETFTAQCVPDQGYCVVQALLDPAGRVLERYPHTAVCRWVCALGLTPTGILGSANLHLTAHVFYFWFLRNHSHRTVDTTYLTLIYTAVNPHMTSRKPSFRWYISLMYDL